MRFTPGCRCCDTADPPCEHCTDDSDTLAVTFDKIISGYCDYCVQFNATWLLDRQPSYLCSWETGIGYVDCDYYGGDMYAGKLTYRISAAIERPDVAHLIWYVWLQYAHSSWPPLSSWNYMTWKLRIESAGSIDCTSQQELLFVAHYTRRPPACTFSETPTCIIN